MSEALEIVPLGGCGGFGMNATLLACGDTAVLIDFGVGFPHDDATPNLRAVADPRPLMSRWPRLRAVWLTHAHDDHTAGLPYLPGSWADAPVYGLPLTIAFARQRFEDSTRRAPAMHEVRCLQPIECGPLTARWIHTTHSVPHSAMIAIETPVGRLVHSGDFKLDRTPVRGSATDLTTLQQLGADGVRLLMVDSTGALRPGWTASESSTVEPLRQVVAQCQGQIFATTFASHLHRIQSLVVAATSAGRKTALLGMRATLTVRIGIDLSLFEAPPGWIVSPEELRRIPPRERMYICGGCQGETDSSLSRLSFGTDSRGTVDVGDTVILSSSIIPGNELPVASLMNRLLRGGARVIHADHHPGLHASGHGARDEIGHLIATLNPRAVMPIHGDRQHLVACQELASDHSFGVRQVPIAEMGESLIVTREAIAFGPRYPLSPLVLEQGLHPLDQETRAQRRRLASAGVLVVTVLMRGSKLEVLMNSTGLRDAESFGLRELIEDVVVTFVRRERHTMSRAEMESELSKRLATLMRRGGRARPETIVTFVRQENP
ncbi:MAG: ribonuclease J [Acidobacteriota bacterium]